ncbi:MAG: hypothetical protein R3F59_03180 [Myxococcota bacterium]
MLAFALLATAHAAPTFVGDPEDVALARAAWAGAAACTGREGSAAPVVALVRRTVPGDYLGVARTDPDTGRLYRIDLNAAPGRHREVVVHEVAHAWVSEGPVALVEGTAELIADCVVQRAPGLAPHQFDDGRSLTGLPDLLAWTKPVEGRPSELHAVRTDAYVGASRLVRTAAEVVGPEALWGSRTVGWAGFRAALAGSPRGGELVAALDAGPRALADALDDADRDGLVAIAEGWAGTSDQRYDTDGDGWWDGTVRAGAVALPADGTPVCAAGPGEGGTVRGVDRVEVARQALPGGGGVAWLRTALPADATGGWWVEAGAAAASCVGTPRVTVWASDEALVARVAPVAAAVEAALARAEGLYGTGPVRVAVGLGGSRSTVLGDGEVVLLSAEDVRRGDAASLGRLAVALRRAWASGERDWAGAEAVARSLR